MNRGLVDACEARERGSRVLGGRIQLGMRNLRDPRLEQEMVRLEFLGSEKLLPGVQQLHFEPCDFRLLHLDEGPVAFLHLLVLPDGEIEGYCCV